MPTKTNHHCLGIVTGSITRDQDQRFQLQLSDGSAIRAGNVAKESPEVSQWQVLPQTASTGEVTRLQVIAEVSTSEADSWQIVGQIAQVAKKKKTALITIEQDDDSDLKLTVSNFPIDLAETLESDETVKITAHLINGRLEVQAMTAVQPPATEKSTSVKAPVLNLDAQHLDRRTQDLSSIALAALAQATGQEDWQLAQLIKRDRRWEWLATNGTNRFTTSNRTIYQTNRDSFGRCSQYWGFLFSGRNWPL
jgi:hypothetical protein